MSPFAPSPAKEMAAEVERALAGAEAFLASYRLDFAEAAVRADAAKAERIAELERDVAASKAEATKLAGEVRSLRRSAKPATPATMPAAPSVDAAERLRLAREKETEQAKAIEAEKERVSELRRQLAAANAAEAAARKELESSKAAAAALTGTEAAKELAEQLAARNARIGELETQLASAASAAEAAQRAAGERQAELAIADKERSDAVARADKAIGERDLETARAKGLGDALAERTTAAKEAEARADRLAGEVGQLKEEVKRLGPGTSSSSAVTLLPPVKTTATAPKQPKFRGTAADKYTLDQAIDAWRAASANNAFDTPAYLGDVEGGNPDVGDGDPAALHQVAYGVQTVLFGAQVVPTALVGDEPTRLSEAMDDARWAARFAAAKAALLDAGALNRDALDAARTQAKTSWNLTAAQSAGFDRLLAIATLAGKKVDLAAGQAAAVLAAASFMAGHGDADSWEAVLAAARGAKTTILVTPAGGSGSAGLASAIAIWQTAKRPTTRRSGYQAKPPQFAEKRAGPGFLGDESVKGALENTPANREEASNRRLYHAVRAQETLFGSGVVPADSASLESLASPVKLDVLREVVESPEWWAAFRTVRQRLVKDGQNVTKKKDEYQDVLSSILTGASSAELLKAAASAREKGEQSGAGGNGWADHMAAFVASVAVMDPAEVTLDVAPSATRIPLALVGDLLLDEAPAEPDSNRPARADAVPPRPATLSPAARGVIRRSPLRG
jgi:hypothetical protein